MSNSMHTPGPWEVSIGNSGSIFGDLNNPVHDGDNPYIGTVAGIGVDVDIPECTANAKLIAAAPEMFDILNRIAIYELAPKDVVKDIEAILDKVR